MRVLGLNLSNNGSICIVDDGQVDFYLESERITRKKRDYNIKPLLKFVDNVDAVAISDSFYRDDVKSLINSKDIASVKSKFPDAQRFDFRDRHHLNHAACGFYNSGFEEAAVIIVDSNGSNTPSGDECETIMHCKTGRRFHWKAVHKRYCVEGDLGIGKEFDAVSKSLGFGWNEAGKVMGLAPYNTHPDATRVQKEWEDRSKELVEIALKKTKCKNVVLTGGCFLNCVVNYKLTKAYPDVTFYAEPVSHDGGTAIGAAYLVHYNPKLKSF